RAIGGNRVRPALLLFVGVGEQGAGDVEVRPQPDRKLEIEFGEIIALILRQRAAEAVKRFRNAFRGVRDERPDLLALAFRLGQLARLASSSESAAAKGPRPSSARVVAAVAVSTSPASAKTTRLSSA
ncbi:hypothetical protein DBT53_002590, partial [Aerococcus mictus]|uniref:hypothetical protein n=1 Tax=Aerococcus mictus TaxID=2976810 RepID=UPI002FD3E071